MATEDRDYDSDGSPSMPAQAWGKGLVQICPCPKEDPGTRKSLPSLSLLEKQTQG